MADTTSTTIRAEVLARTEKAGFIVGSRTERGLIVGVAHAWDLTLAPGELTDDLTIQGMGAWQWLDAMTMD